MGFNTTVLVLNDGLGEIEKDPNFGKKLVGAILSLGNKPADVSAGNHMNAVQVIETHHADSTVAVAVGGNTASVLASTYGYQTHDDVIQFRLLEALADKLGYKLVKKKPVQTKKV
jgi:hypothetical protein